MEDLNLSGLKSQSSKDFFRGYNSAIEDFHNALNNNLFDLVDEPIDLVLEEKEEGGLKATVKVDEYNKLSTIDKIKVEMFLKIAQDLINQMECFAMEAYQGLEEGEMD